MNTTTNTANKTDTTNTIKTLMQQGLDQVDKLNDDKRITRHIRARVLAGAHTKEDALVLAGHLDNGDDQCKKLAADLRAMAPGLTATPTAKSKKVAKKSAARVRAQKKTQATSKTKSGTEASEAPESQRPIPLKNLTVNKYNRSFAIPPSKDHVKLLADSIDEIGLLGQIVLVRSKGKDGHYEIVAGATRVAAIRKFRGVNGMLKPGEYIIREDLDPDSLACLDVAISENRDRFNSSPYDTGRYIGRLLRDEKLKQNEIADMLRIDREVAGALSTLPEYFDQLPATWRKDLAADEGEGDSNLRRAITVSHWRLMAPKVKKAGVTDELKKFMTIVAKEEWTTARLYEKLAGYQEGRRGRRQEDREGNAQGRPRQFWRREGAR
jgi:ParB-like chromosome segregation protein Spo0J